jgi:NAD(P)-dependent dehydrogenase (short-subunit alcohol dehydrogenase family)
MPYHERHSPPGLFQRYVTGKPLGRAGTAEEVADVIVLLASPATRSLTGETIEVNSRRRTD